MVNSELLSLLYDEARIECILLSPYIQTEEHQLLDKMLIITCRSHSLDIRWEINQKVLDLESCCAVISSLPVTSAAPESPETKLGADDLFGF